VNRFIEECRREWKRLRVPDPLADEMAADLAADLEEAEAEGVTPEEVLGSDTSDPRSFAASWAAERGVIPPRLTGRLSRRSLMLAGIAALTITAAIGAALVIFASPDASAPPTAIRVPAPPPSPATVWVAGLSREDAALAQLRAAVLTNENAVAQREAVLLQANGDSVLALPRAHGPGVEIHTVGSILLIVGIAGSLVSMLFLLWLFRARPRRLRS
jgi:hypothetical protein